MTFDDWVEESPVNWQDCTVSLCDVPLEQVAREHLDHGHPALAFEYLWRKLSVGGELPKRDQFKPSMVRSLLKWVVIFDRITDDKNEDRYCVRLVGTAAEILMHENHTGQYLDEFTDEECLRSRTELMRRAFETAEPAFGTAGLGEQGEFKTSVLLGMFPFAGDGDKPDEIFVVVAPTQVGQRAFL